MWRLIAAIFATRLTAAIVIFLATAVLAAMAPESPPRTTTTLDSPPGTVQEVAQAAQQVAEPALDARPATEASFRGATVAGDAAREDSSPVGSAAGAAETQSLQRAPGLAAPSPFQAAVAAVAARSGAGHPFRVGIQAGHWKNSELPAELSVLRGSTGAAAPGWKEVDVNLAVAQKVTALMAQAGVAVDLLPSTVPVGYKADAFVAIHADANKDATMTGFKVARSRWSTIRDRDDALVAAMTGSYQTATGLGWHAKTITTNMLEYYAFDRTFKHSVATSTPAIILEMGFLTNDRDRHLLLDEQDKLAQAVAVGLLSFIAR